MTARCDHIDTAQRFAQFHNANPHVFRELLTLARQARAEGATKLGMKMLFEVARWNRRAYLHTDHGTDPWRLNNIYTPYYSRLLQVADPSLEGMFETRGDVELPAGIVESVTRPVGPEQTTLDDMLEAA